MFGNNFYNPYMYQSYYQTANAARGLGSLANGATSSVNKVGLTGLLKKFSLSGFLNGASKTLNVVNQAIPVYYQVKPMISNAKTMFRVMGAIKSDDKPIKNNTNQIKNSNTPTTVQSNNESIIYNRTNETSDENPIFFI